MRDRLVDTVGALEFESAEYAQRLWDMQMQLLQFPEIPVLPMPGKIVKTFCAIAGFRLHKANEDNAAWKTFEDRVVAAGIPYMDSLPARVGTEATIMIDARARSLAGEVIELFDDLWSAHWLEPIAPLRNEGGNGLMAAIDALYNRYPSTNGMMPGSIPTYMHTTRLLRRSGFKHAPLACLLWQPPPLACCPECGSLDLMILHEMVRNEENPYQWEGVFPSPSGEFRGECLCCDEVIDGANCFTFPPLQLGITFTNDTFVCYSRNDVDEMERGTHGE